jgi:hypothetical protein
MLVFDCSDYSSLSYLLDLEQSLGNLFSQSICIGIRFEGSSSGDIFQDIRTPSVAPYFDDTMYRSKMLWNPTSCQWQHCIWQTNALSILFSSLLMNFRLSYH